MKATRIILASALIAITACSIEPDASRTAHPLINVVGNSGGVNELAAGNNNDWTVPAVNKILFVPHVSGSTLTGFAKGNAGDGEGVFVRNHSELPLTFAHQSSASQAGNRFILPHGVDLILRPFEGFFIDWDVTEDAWIPYTQPSIEPLEPIHGVISTITPSRSLGTAFQPNADATVAVRYSTRIDSTLSLTGGARGRVELRSDASNPPTTVRARVAGGTTGTLTIGLNITDTAEDVLSYLVPAGHYVLLQSVNEVGTPTYTITAQVEQEL